MNLAENIKFGNSIDSFNHNRFFRGVVEDANDPEKLGRVKVRILGVHSDNFLFVTTDSLPWAEVLVPNIFRNQMSGIGISSVPLEGSWVWVFFDNNDWNKPIVIGTTTGISKEPSLGLAFSDRNMKYPLIERLNESDINRLARGEKFALTSISLKRKLKKEFVIPCVQSYWSEPDETSSKAEYPHNTVIETPSGNILEYDDTPGNSRISYFHSSGSYWEFIDNGDHNTKVQNDNYFIVERDSMEFIKRDYFKTINRNKEELIQGNKSTSVNGNFKEEIKGSTEIDILVSKTEKVTGKVTEKYSTGQSTDGGPMIQIKAGMIYLN